MHTKKKVLIIEDDEDTSDLLVFETKQLKLRVVNTSDILPVSAIEEMSPDLIITDHYVNGKLGGDFCLALKSNLLTHKIPVILLSAATGLAQIAADCHADAFLEKPFNLSELENLINTFLQPVI